MNTLIPHAPGSLRGQARRLERQILERQRSVRILTVGIKRKLSLRLARPFMLLGAVGLGVVIEQTSRYRQWSFSSVAKAAYTGIQLFGGLAASLPTDKTSAEAGGGDGPDRI